MNSFRFTFMIVLMVAAAIVALFITQSPAIQPSCSANLVIVQQACVLDLIRLP